MAERLKADRKLDPDAMPPLLRRLFRGSQTGAVIAGVDDDDCAVIRSPRDFVIVTTDYLNARPIAVELGIGNYETLGRLVVAANISDLCGTGARPEALLIAVTMNRAATEADFLDLMRGAKKQARQCNVPVVGGDTKLGDADAILGVAVGGARTRRNLFLKNGAEVGDLLWVSGPIGSCCAAVLGLSRDYGSDRWRTWAKRRITAPKVPLGKSRALSSSRLGRGGIDISDGLGADLRRMCTASGVGAVVDAASIPLSTQAREIARFYNLAPWAFALGIGGDFQFLATTSASSKAKVTELGFHLVGRMTRARTVELRLPDGRRSNMPGTGHRDVRDVSFCKEVEILLGEDPR
jgi:thiamine-monophosphate kinase